MKTLIAILSFATCAIAGQLVEGQMQTNLIPHPLKFTVLLPDGYAASKDAYPLLFLLHGGGGDNGFLKRMQPVIEREMNAGTLPKVIVATPDAQRSFYMDYKDGSEKWESLIMGPFLDYLRKNYRIVDGRKGLYMLGISMGGMGDLRMAMKYPDRIGSRRRARAGSRSGAPLERRAAAASLLAIAGVDGEHLRKAVRCGVLGSQQSRDHCEQQRGQDSRVGYRHLSRRRNRRRFRVERSHGIHAPDSVEEQYQA